VKFVKINNFLKSMDHKIYMRRCLELAKLGKGNTIPNPLVGAVIVYNDKVIGEGYHRKYGESHAEVNAINNVKDKTLLKKSTLYVNLEPCIHYGKTPPCSIKIIEENIPEVIIGTLDPNPLVNGKGIEFLKNNNIKVNYNIIQKECIELNRRFFTYHLKKRPYIILKWAQTKDNFIDLSDRLPEKPFVWISNELLKTLVHKWRSEEQAILIGSKTAIKDNPELTTRNWPGKSPIRLVINRNANLPETLKIFDNKVKTIIFNEKFDSINGNLEYKKVDFGKNLLKDILRYLYDIEIQSIIVEGGAITLKNFIEEELWDEARVIIGNKYFYNGIKAPYLECEPDEEYFFCGDKLRIYYNKKHINSLNCLLM